MIGNVSDIICKRLCIHLQNKVLISKARVEDYPIIQEFLLESSFSYPGIEVWWNNQVIPSYKLDERVILIAKVNDSLEGLFIGKKGKSAKICTLRVRKDFRYQGIGKTLISEGVDCLMDQNTKDLYVTISEVAKDNCASFFESMGFHQEAVERNRYRRGVDEFIYTCPLSYWITRNVITPFGLNAHDVCELEWERE